MYDPAQGVMDFLAGDSVGTPAGTSAWGIYLGRLPDKPDASILVNQTGGQAPWPHLLLNFPHVQVLVRGSRGGYADARGKIDEVIDSLLGIPAQAVGSDWWQGIIQLGEAGFIGYDENSRPIFTANFRMIVEPNSGQYRQSI
jgi:hypothetical protein